MRKYSGMKMHNRGLMKILTRQIRIFLLISAVYFFRSCSPDPSLEILESYSISFENGSGQRVLPGDKIDVVMRVFDNLNKSVDSVKVNFEIISGGGSLSISSDFTGSKGKAQTEWTIGGESRTSVVRASIYKSSGKYLTYKDMTTTCFIPDTWIEVTDDPDGSITDMIADTVNHLTFMVAKGALYMQGNRYFIWEKINEPLLEIPRTIEMDRNRVIYVSTWSGDVVKSTDHGESWEKCTKPYPEDPYYVYMSVSNDNYIWVGKFDYPTRFSKDGGISWQDANALSTFLNGNTYRLKNGILVNHGTNGISRNRFNISYDDGLTWISRETPGYSTVIYVTRNDEIFIGTQENGFTFYQTTNLGLTYKKVHSVFPQWGTTMENNIFTKWNGFYYIIVPGYGILKSVDLVHYENYWRNSNLNDLFIDHNGVLIAKDWDYKTVYYWKNSD
ncbi:MAG: hypothetical protein A2V64_08090 [Bacteroidetes bacterium RBG_13_43_22]|nr:MAG: hypothetical protein A2V64_08090 [Bacteroidetes bacterium RBG_13_43_22]